MAVALYGEGVDITLDVPIENAGSLYLQMQLAHSGYSPIEKIDFSQARDNFPNSRFLGVGRFGGIEKQILDLTDWLKVHHVEELPEDTKLYIRFVANM
jgi:hypothetical protein